MSTSSSTSSSSARLLHQDRGDGVLRARRGPGRRAQPDPGAPGAGGGPERGGPERPFRPHAAADLGSSRCWWCVAESISSGFRWWRGVSRGARSKDLRVGRSRVQLEHREQLIPCRTSGPGRPAPAGGPRGRATAADPAIARAHDGAQRRRSARRPGAGDPALPVEIRELAAYQGAATLARGELVSSCGRISSSAPSGAPTRA